MRTRVIFLAAVMMTGALSLPRSFLAQESAPWLGTWKLNPGKSATNSDRYKRVTSRIESAAGGLKVTYDMIGERGGITHMEWSGRFDGKDYPVEGVDYVLTNAYTRLNDHSYQIVVKVDGALAATATVVISADGNTLTTVTKEKGSPEQNVSTTTVYDRQ